MKTSADSYGAFLSVAPAGFEVKRNRDTGRVGNTMNELLVRPDMAHEMPGNPSLGQFQLFVTVTIWAGAGKETLPSAPTYSCSACSASSRSRSNCASLIMSANVQPLTSV